MDVEEYKISFCHKIKTLRKQKNIILEKLAEDSGIPLNMLEQLEQNILPEEMMVDDACALARVLQCELYELLKGISCCRT